MSDMGAAAILMTGAIGGIGRAIAARRSADGHPLILLDREDALLPERATDRRRVCDTPHPATVAAAFKGLQGSDAGILNVAGRNHAARTEDMQSGDWSSMIDVNVGGMLAVVGVALPLPLMQGVPDAAIVKMASVAGYMASADDPADFATTAGVEGLTEALATTLGPRVISIPASAPGWVDTGLNHAATAPLDAEAAAALLASASARHLLRRITRLEEIADALAWLVSLRARHLNGTALFVDGGLVRVH